MTNSAQNHLRRSGVLLAAGLLALLSLVLTAPAASAAAGSGWVRLTHLSPDTPEVDVTLTSLSDNKWVLKLNDVGYGDVSAYKKVPAGTYIASMVPADGSSSTPRINQSVTVKDGYAYTVAAVGKRADLTGKVITDDLRPPAKGQAKVRLLQASNVAPSVDVTAVEGPTLAKDATFGSTTGYAQIAAGVWTIKIDPAEDASAPVTAKVTAAPGSINTIVVLDGPNGVVSAKQIRDASGAPAMPKKKTGVETGGGGTATEVVGTVPADGAPLGTAPLGTPALGGLALLVGAGVAARAGLRRRARATVRR